MKQWISQHRQALSLVLQRMRRTRAATAMMVAVIGVALSFPAGLYLLLDNIGKLAGDVERDPQISLFLSMNVSDQRIASLEKTLRAHPMLKEVQFVGRETAWAELKQKAGLEDASGGLEKNPLPDAFIVHTQNNEPAAVEQLQLELQALDGVEHAQLDAAWVKRLYSLLQIARHAVLVLAAMLGFALLAVIGNTIRLQILTQREEIEVSQLIGATDSFIRRPFLYAGSIHGLGGGIAAWLILYVTIAMFNHSIRDLATLYGSDFRLQSLDMQASLVLLITAACLGWLGSHLAVSRFLSSITQR